MKKCYSKNIIQGKIEMCLVLDSEKIESYKINMSSMHKIYLIVSKYHHYCKVLFLLKRCK